MLTTRRSREAHFSALLEQMVVGMGHRSEDFAGLSRAVTGVFPYSISKSASGIFCRERENTDVLPKCISGHMLDLHVQPVFHI